MDLNSLTAISPVDGRYRKTTQSLGNYFSEFALIKYRVQVEIEYFIALSNSGIAQLKPIAQPKVKSLRNIYLNFSEADALRIKNIETVTNHDVKAVEYFIKEELQKSGFSKQLEFIHFGLTSQDINNTSVPLSLKEFTEKEYLPLINELLEKLKSSAKDWKNISLLARTHGQSASPTKLGKEVMVFVERITNQLKQLQAVPYSAKFGGATGNFNAHHVAYPKINWEKFANNFVNNTLKLNRSQYTTQIEHYDNIASLFNAYARINTILLDLSRDVWMYVMQDYFKQKIKKGEIGSSAMPHKVNPIDFENAEGNLGIANALFEHMAAKLPVSRLQRDLTDSTVLRNIGVPMAHTVISIRSVLKGWDKLIVNEDKINQDLENNLAVVAEAIQTILRREGVEKPYEKLKDLTRGNEKLTKEHLKTFIQNLNIDKKVKEELLKITPQNYTGIF